MLLFAESSSTAPQIDNSHQAYSAFLQQTNGLDLWRSQPDYSLQNSFTYQARQCRPGQQTPLLIQSTIDCIATSQHGILFAHIHVLSNFIPCTDHRPILSSIILLAPATLHGQSSIPHPIPASVYTPHFLFPHHGEKERLLKFSDIIHCKIQKDPTLLTEITDDESFQTVYHHLTQILLSVASQFFQQPNPPTSDNYKPSNSTIRLLLREIRHVNRLISFTKSILTSHPHPFFHEPWSTPYFTAFLTSPSSSPLFSTQSFLDFLKTIRRTLNKIHFAEERAERKSKQSRFASFQIRSLLTGGSAKKLSPTTFSSLPLALSLSPDLSDHNIITGPDRIKHATQLYFQTLYQRTHRPPQEKPWLTTPSIQQIASKTHQSPFQWPQLLHLFNLKNLLRKGNSRPTPGPDGWEKWFLRHITDDSLSIILRLLNFITPNSHFPSCTKHTNISTIHKRGPNTLLTNYCGIACSNLILNLPFAWLNTHLSPYVTQQNIVPQTQVAAQPGTQARDLLSFISQVETWAA